MTTESVCVTHTWGHVFNGDAYRCEQCGKIETGRLRKAQAKIDADDEYYWTMVF